MVIFIVIDFQTDYSLTYQDLILLQKMILVSQDTFIFLVINFENILNLLYSYPENMLKRSFLFKSKDVLQLSTWHDLQSFRLHMIHLMYQPYKNRKYHKLREIKWYWTNKQTVEPNQFMFLCFDKKIFLPPENKINRNLIILSSNSLQLFLKFNCNT